MNKNHCPHNSSPRRRPGPVACKQLIISKLKSFLQQRPPAFAGVTTMCRVSLIMTIVLLLTIIATPAAACPSWIAQWRNHNGPLPNSSETWTSSTANGTWSVTADFGDGARTVSGESRCVNAGANNHRCYCRTTMTEGVPGTWENPFASAKGSGAEVCTGTMPGTACSGSWVFDWSHWLAVGCANGCAHDCAWCVRLGSRTSCTRAAVLPP